MGVLYFGSFSNDSFSLLFSIYLQFKQYKDMGSGDPPPSQGPSCLTCRIISLLIFQLRTSGDLGRWPWHYESHEDWHWELAVTLRGGQPPGDGGGWLLLKLRRKLVMSPTSWGSALGNRLLFFQGEGHYLITHDDRFCCCCVLCGASPSKSEMFIQAPTLGTHRDRPLAGLQQQRVAKFKALANTKMGLRPKRRMNFVLWGSSGCWGVRLLNWPPHNQGSQMHLDD